MTSATDGTRAAILLVEDDPTIATMLIDRLGSGSYCVWHAASAAEAEAIVDAVRPNLIIVDLMLPDRNGLLLCASLKERQPAPIIICSGTKRKDDPLLGFKLGADDFIAKPFSADELEARIEAVLRRAASDPVAESPPRGGPLRIGELVIDRGACEVTLGGQPIHLTPTEYRLLCELASHPGAMLSRAELAERIWGHDDAGIRRSLEVHLRRLRAKLNAGPVPMPPLVTVRGFGYRIVPEPRREAAHPAGA